MAFNTKISKYFIFVYFIIRLQTVGAYANPVAECEVRLNAGQINALQAAKDAKDFAVQILQGNVNGRDRLVVLLGESHYKTLTDKELGKEVLNQFQAYGYEGADSSKTLGGKFFSAVTYAMSKLIKKLSTRSSESTIDDALHRVHMLKAVAKGLHEQMAELSPEQRNAKFAEIEHPQAIVEVDGVKIDRPLLLQLLQELKRLSGVLTESDSSAPLAPRAFHLEAGHRPDVLEHFSSVAIPGYVIWAGYRIIYLLVFGVKDSVVTHSATPAFQSTALVGAGLALSYYLTKLEILLTRRLGFGIVQCFLYPLFIGIEHGRNKTMVRNTIEAFEKNDDVLVLLNIVGRAHVKGMAKLLEKNHGFTVQTLP